MLVSNGDGTYIGGPLDMCIVLHDVETGRFHPAFFEEHPMPGPVLPSEDVEVVRLKSNMHHTEGFATKDEAVANMKDDLAKKIQLQPLNIVEKPIEWDGQLGVVLLATNPLRTKEISKIVIG